MADNSTLNLMLKIRADLADASRALQGLAGDVEEVGSAATTSSQKLSTTARAQDSVAESARSHAQAEQSAAAAEWQPRAGRTGGPRRCVTDRRCGPAGGDRLRRLSGRYRPYPG